MIMGLLNDSLHDLKYSYVLVLLPFLVIGFMLLMFFNEHKASKQKSYEHRDIQVNLESRDHNKEEDELSPVTKADDDEVSEEEEQEQF
jgi:choline-glycine betaine transporter